MSQRENVENSETDLKNKLSEFRVSCDFKEYNRDGLVCFSIVKEDNTYTCDLHPYLMGRFGRSCHYCFSEEGYLDFIECFGDDKYKEETEDLKRYYKWEKI